MEKDLIWVSEISWRFGNKIRLEYKQIRSFGELEANRHFWNEKKGYLKAKFEELLTSSKIKNIRDFYRGISDCK
jgi:hypothetical protein